ncbi:MAG: Lrp/AsnC ligand binding domain-containing protein [Bacteroidaceae bacterium]|nr:Lrp/AsnC ligand binding domain-containing protein [Bacteroidaceae bacterium]
MATRKTIESEKNMDDLDRKILQIITQNARIPFRDVAVQCGVSRAAVHQRVQRLFDDGVIVGSSYNIDPKSIGYSTCTYVGLTLEKGSLYHQVVVSLAQIPEVIEAHFTTGRYTMLIKLYARDNAHLMQLLNSRIQEIEGVVSTETLISLDQGLQKTVPIEISED